MSKPPARLPGAASCSSDNIVSPSPGYVFLGEELGLVAGQAIDARIPRVLRPTDRYNVTQT